MLFLKSNPFHSSSFSLYLFLAFLLFLFFSPLVIFAQDSGREESNAGIKDLGRRSKIFVDKIKTGVAIDEIDHDSINLGVELDSGLGVFDAFFASFSMILVSEIGDETFIIAALMAMRHPKSIVLSGALSALFVMTVLSTGLGRIVPNLISRKHTNSAATVLYAFFGLRLLYIAWRSDPKCSQKKEMEELATHKNAVGVAVGAIIGHTICTSLAVVGGSMLASKISQRTVATVGGLLFLGFSLSSYFYPPL
ncbi:GDT1-like protein 3 isoform X3 [Olea europaea var. sylvestris]|uniref:GDT1-like protein 3 isoform X3 n=1 Tax=Olea europaea var. sylvestris TaxID=158386 RepID=UPI000C1D7F21|nr:GDT1-like protein 3 isoform X3 [Olea europaea var. sylvestris]